MNTYIALFRGINVGGKNILPMEKLRMILADLGFENVSTLIQSGNAVFQIPDLAAGDAAPEIAGAIGKAIFVKYGIEPEILILDTDALSAAIDRNPFETEKGNTLHFIFMFSEPENPDLEGILAARSETEDIRIIGKVFYLHAPEGIGRSKLASRVERFLGVPVTRANWNTVNKLNKMASGKK